MSTKRKGRLLDVLVIDDRLPDIVSSETPTFGTHFNIRQIRSWAAAQSLIAKSDEMIDGADLVLTDVSWVEDPDVKVMIDENPGGKFNPVGPLLALPFIGRRAVMACSIYSAHIQNKLVQQHPVFLLAMGLIAARTHDAPPEGNLSRTLSPIASNSRLDQMVEQLATNVPLQSHRALNVALRQFRDRILFLADQSQIFVRNRAALTQRLREVRASNKRSVRVDDTLYLEIVGRTWSDRISLRSLFADQLAWLGHYLVQTGIDFILDWLANLGEDAVQQAIALIDEQDQRQEAEENSKRHQIGNAPRVAATKLLDEMYGRLSLEERAEIFRYVVLFANVHANEDREDDSPRAMATTVFDRLSNKLQHNTYTGWFGVPRPGQPPVTGVRKGLPPLRFLARHNILKEKIFLRAGSVIETADQEAIAKYRASMGLRQDPTRYVTAKR